MPVWHNNWNRMALAAMALLGGVVTSTEARAESFPTYGVTVDGPKGWSPLRRDMEKRVARWQLVVDDGTATAGAAAKPAGAAAAGKRTRLMLIDEGHPIDKTIDDTGAALAKKFDGRVDEKLTTIDGERAVRILAEHHGAGMQPVEVLAAVHDGLLFIVFAATDGPGISCHAEIEQVRASWKWTKRQEPTSVLKDGVAYDADDLKLRLNVPRSAAFIEGMADRASLHLAFGDPSIGKNEALVMIQRVPAQPGATFAALSDGFRHNWDAQPAREKALVWEVNDAKTGTAVSNVLSMSPGDGKPPQSVVWGIRWVDDQTVLLLNATFPAATPTEVAAYQKFFPEFLRGMAKLPAKEK